MFLRQVNHDTSHIDRKSKENEHTMLQHDEENNEKYTRRCHIPVFQRQVSSSDLQLDGESCEKMIIMCNFCMFSRDFAYKTDG